MDKYYGAIGGKLTESYEPPEQNKKHSLLKPYTNNDRINDMSVEEKAKKLDELVGNDCDICPFCNIMGDAQECELSEYHFHTCEMKYQKWLESEAT